MTIQIVTNYLCSICWILQREVPHGCEGQSDSACHHTVYPASPVLIQLTSLMSWFTTGVPVRFPSSILVWMITESEEMGVVLTSHVGPLRRSSLTLMCDWEKDITHCPLPESSFSYWQVFLLCH